MDIKERILSQIDIVDVVSSFVELKKNGVRYFGCCPIHKEKTPSFCVTPSMQMWHCFGCGKGGNVIDFIMEVKNLPFWDAMKWLADKYHIEMPKAKPENSVEQERIDALYEANATARHFYIKCLETDERAKAYVEKRWGLEFARTVGIGYAPDEWHALDTYLIENNIARKPFEDVGLIKVDTEKNRRFDFLRGRITIPIYSRTGKVIGFTARDITEKPDTAKYLNSNNSDIYNKTESLFGINFATAEARKTDEMLLVEGAPDVLRLQCINIPNAVACLGAKYTETQMRLIQRYTNNVCFIPDCDVRKPGAQFATGFDAVIKNAKTAMSVGMSVYVRELPQPDPTKKVDCDEYVQTPEVFDTLEKKEFIIWYAEKLANGAESIDQKTAMYREIANVLCFIQDTVKVDLLISKMNKQYDAKGLIRKAYSQAKSEFDQAHQIESHKRYVDMYGQYGFWVEESSYFAPGPKGITAKWSNFTMEPLFHIKDVVFPKRLYKITNGKQTEIIELKAEDLVSIQKFKQKVEGLGNFIWQAKDEQLTKLKVYLYDQTETAVEIKQLGWHRDGFFAFGNGIYFNGYFYEADELGIVRLPEEKNYYLPAKSIIYVTDNTLFSFEKNFSHLKLNECTLTDAFTRIANVYGDNGIIGLAFYMASLFKDLILSQTSLHFPILNLFGPKGSGKTELAVSLKRFFQLKDIPMNLNNTTIAAIANSLAQVSNAIVHFDEFRNDLDTKIRESLKGVWDNTGRSRMNMDRDKQIESTMVDCALILSGQEMATADIALFSRFVFLRFANTTFTPEQKKAFNELSDLQRKGFSHITLQLLNYRPQVEREIPTALKEVSNELQDRLGKTIIEDRILGNYKVLLVIYKIVGKYVTLPFTYERLFELCFAYMVEQQQSCFTSNELGNFWECVQVLVQSGEMVLDSDFRIVDEKELKTDTVQQEYLKSRLILYLRPSRVFQLYAKHYKTVGETVLPRQSLKYYLENSKEYLGMKKAMRFKMIVHGQQQYEAVGDSQGVKQVAISQNDRAMAFDYEAIMNNYSIDINSYTIEDLPE